MDEAVDAAWGQGVLPRLKQGNRAAAIAAGKLGRALAMRAHSKSQVWLLLPTIAPRLQNVSTEQQCRLFLKQQEWMTERLG